MLCASVDGDEREETGLGLYWGGCGGGWGPTHVSTKGITFPRCPMGWGQCTPGLQGAQGRFQLPSDQRCGLGPACDTCRAGHPGTGPGAHTCCLLPGAWWDEGRKPGEALWRGCPAVWGGWRAVSWLARVGVGDGEVQRHLCRAGGTPTPQAGDGS